MGIFSWLDLKKSRESLIQKRYKNIDLYYRKGRLTIAFHSTGRVNLIDLFDKAIHCISWRAKFGDHPERTSSDNTTSFPKKLLQQRIKFLRVYTPSTHLECYTLLKQKILVKDKETVSGHRSFRPQESTHIWLSSPEEDQDNKDGL